MKLKYKNYIGIAQWQEEDKIYYGKIIGINDIITFVADKKEDLQEAMEDSINDYIEFCKETNKRPEKSYSGQFRLRINPETHARLSREAAYRGISLNSYIEEKLNK